MIIFEVKYGGRNPDPLDKQVVETMTNSIKSKIKKFESEAQGFQGKVSIEIPYNFQNPKIDIQGLPKALIRKIKKEISEKL